MKLSKRPVRLAWRRSAPAVESLEQRALTALVFVFNGNSFNVAGPSVLTANAAAILARSGNRVVQLSNPRINSAAELKHLAAGVARLAGGQPVGLVGFSAGGALALRIAALPGVNASAVLDYYGVPDVRDYLSLHSRDHFYRPIAGLAPFSRSVVSLLSGPLQTKAHVVAAFGQSDPHVQAATSSADLHADGPSADIYIYPGGHGVSIDASPSALDDFLAHLG